MSTTHPPPTKSAFFYGTLMAPQILQRVCHGRSPPSSVQQTSLLKTTPALLPSYRRHRVKQADYPAILPHASSSVRGTHVSGLTETDLWRLDIFEGSEYRREKVRVRLLGEGGEDEGEEVEAETYVWCAGAERLEGREWDFEEFRREKMKFWVGGGGGGGDDEDGEFAEVDEAVAAAAAAGADAGQHDGTGGRGLNGEISNALREHHQSSK